MHRLVLNVEADKLFNEDNPSREFIVNCCTLESKDKKFKGQIMKEDESVFIVKANDKVRWQGEAIGDGESGFDKPEANLDYDVSIDLISFQFKGENYFNEVVVLGKGGKIKKVTAKVKNLSAECEDYWYTIYFTIFKEDQEKAFFIDPKLRIYRK